MEACLLSFVDTIPLVHACAWTLQGHMRLQIIPIGGIGLKPVSYLLWIQFLYLAGTELASTVEGWRQTPLCLIDL